MRMSNESSDHQLSGDVVDVSCDASRASNSTDIDASNVLTNAILPPLVIGMGSNSSSNPLDPWDADEAATAQLMRASGVPILVFYHGGEDMYGRSLAEMLAYDDEKMEECHDYVQWIWPLHQPSAYARDAPVLDRGTAAALAASPMARRGGRAALVRFAAFWGLGVFGLDMNATKLAHWCVPGNHNLLRVTRVLRSSRLLGLDNDAVAFAAAVNTAAASVEVRLPVRTLGFWSRAATGPLFEPLR